MTPITQEDAATILSVARQTDQAALFEASTTPQLEVISLTIKLDTAQTVQAPYKIGFKFRSVFVRTATDQLVSINMRINTQDSMQSDIPLQLNDSFRMPYPVAAAYLNWAAQSGKTITLVFFLSGEFQSGAQLSLTSGGNAIIEGSSVANGSVTLTAATAGVIFAANTLRKVSQFRNDSGASIWVGPGGVNNSTGFELKNGEVFYWKNTAALYGYSVAGCTFNTLQEA